MDQTSDAKSVIDEIAPIFGRLFDMLDEIYEIGTHRKN